MSSSEPPTTAASDRAAGQRWRARAAAGDFGPSTAQDLAAAGRRRKVVFTAVVGVVVLPSLAAIVLQSINGQDVTVPVLVIVGALVVGAIWWLLLRRDDHRRWAGRAVVQGLVERMIGPGTVLQQAADTATLPGMIFTAGRHPATTDRVAWKASGRSVEIATHRYLLGTKTRTEVYRCRYLAVQLEPAAGRPVLAALELVTPGGEPASSLPMTFPELPTTRIGSPDHPARDRYELRCRAKDVRRSRELLTDGILELLFDEQTPLEAEITGGWFFAYCFTAADPADPDLWRRLLGIAGELDAAPPTAN